jgi:hypothetical protein
MKRETQDQVSEDGPEQRHTATTRQTSSTVRPGPLERLPLLMTPLVGLPLTVEAVRRTTEQASSLAKQVRAEYRLFTPMTVTVRDSPLASDHRASNTPGIRSASAPSLWSEPVRERSFAAT